MYDPRVDELTEYEVYAVNLRKRVINIAVGLPDSSATLMVPCFGRFGDDWKWFCKSVDILRSAFGVEITVDKNGGNPRLTIHRPKSGWPKIMAKVKRSAKGKYSKLSIPWNAIV